MQCINTNLDLIRGSFSHFPGAVLSDVSHKIRQN
jgi:hypothetical protein